MAFVPVLSGGGTGRNSNDNMTHGSLFSGIGGFDLGFERAGIETVWQVEIDPFCRKVLEKHWPNVARYDDIRECCGLTSWGLTCNCGRKYHIDYGTKGLEWPNYRPIDIVTGGFPCQDLSISGNRVGLDGARSGLWKEMWRLVRDLRPRYVVMENVPTLLGWGLGRILGALAEIGYDAEWDCLSAEAFGAPHLRQRLFVVGYSSSKRLQDRSEKQTRENTGQGSWWMAEPELDRVANGIPYRMDRTKGIGNAVVPQIAEWIGRRIIEAEENK